MHKSSLISVCVRVHLCVSLWMWLFSTLRVVSAYLPTALAYRQTLHSPLPWLSVWCMWGPGCATGCLEEKQDVSFPFDSYLGLNILQRLRCFTYSLSVLVCLIIELLSICSSLMALCVLVVPLEDRNLVRPGWTVSPACGVCKDCNTLPDECKSGATPGSWPGQGGIMAQNSRENRRLCLDTSGLIFPNFVMQNLGPRWPLASFQKRILQATMKVR